MARVGQTQDQKHGAQSRGSLSTGLTEYQGQREPRLPSLLPLETGLEAGDKPEGLLLSAMSRHFPELHCTLIYFVLKSSFEERVLWLKKNGGVGTLVLSKLSFYKWANRR